ncbi:hypothetical protein C5C33_10000 [Rathayibacter sp. AY1H3]|nr:hypothetical protein C5C33_10000 [Rathayibacter sp. AY1H3]
MTVIALIRPNRSRRIWSIPAIGAVAAVLAFLLASGLIFVAAHGTPRLPLGQAWAWRGRQMSVAQTRIAELRGASIDPSAPTHVVLVEASTGLRWISRGACMSLGPCRVRRSGCGTARATAPVVAADGDSGYDGFALVLATRL